MLVPVDKVLIAQSSATGSVLREALIVRFTKVCLQSEGESCGGHMGYLFLKGFTFQNNLNYIGFQDPVPWTLCYHNIFFVAGIKYTTRREEEFILAHSLRVHFTVGSR